jgi:2-polyprenyl-3-methyl-5-hydroxy-6-metoxy-1,4-benzoquinol methylase
MKNDPFSDARVLDAWNKNARPWTNAIREEKIASRRLVTNQAIVDTVLRRAPATALDIGCGEGWLARALSDEGIAVTGVDAVAELIQQASRSGGGEFHVMSYEDIAAGRLEATFDAVIANFSLIGKESVEKMLARVPALLNEDGALIIQTLHPVAASGDQPYEDGWRQGSWAGIDGDFSDPAPWYFRTMDGWIELIADSGFEFPEVVEPLHPETGAPASVIFVAAPKR